MVERPIQHKAQPSTVWVHSPSSHKSCIDHQMHIMCFIVTYPELELATTGCASTRMTSSFNNFVILAIPHASYSKGSKGMGGAFDLPMQVTISTYYSPPHNQVSLAV